MFSNVKDFAKACSCKQACLSLLLLRSCLWCLSLDLDRERLCLLLLLSLSLDLDLDLRGIRPAVACDQADQLAALPRCNESVAIAMLAGQTLRCGDACISCKQHAVLIKADGEGRQASILVVRRLQPDCTSCREIGSSALILGLCWRWSLLKARLLARRPGIPETCQVCWSTFVFPGG
jgi:hypothetical protein